MIIETHILPCVHGSDVWGHTGRQAHSHGRAAIQVYIEELGALDGEIYRLTADNQLSNTPAKTWIQNI